MDLWDKFMWNSFQVHREALAEIRIQKSHFWANDLG